MAKKANKASKEHRGNVVTAPVAKEGKPARSAAEGKPAKPAIHGKKPVEAKPAKPAVHGKKSAEGKQIKLTAASRRAKPVAEGKQAKSKDKVTKSVAEGKPAKPKDKAPKAVAEDKQAKSKDKAPKAVAEDKQAKSTAESRQSKSKNKATKSVVDGSQVKAITEAEATSPVAEGKQAKRARAKRAKTVAEDAATKPAAKGKTSEPVAEGKRGKKAADAESSPADDTLPTAGSAEEDVLAPKRGKKKKAKKGLAADQDAAEDDALGASEEDLDPQADLELTEAFLKGLIEALLFSSDHPISLKDLAREARLDKKRTAEILEKVVADYRNRGMVVEEVADGYCFRSNPQYASYVQKLLSLKPIRLSRAQLETLAVIAYRQPVTRPEIDEIRGVDSGPVIKGLLERDLVKMVGKKDEPGRPMLYATTPAFLDLFNLKSLEALPTLREFAELTEESRETFEVQLGEKAPAGAVVPEDAGEFREASEEVLADAYASSGEDGSTVVHRDAEEFREASEEVLADAHANSTDHGFNGLSDLAPEETDIAPEPAPDPDEFSEESPN